MSEYFLKGEINMTLKSFDEFKKSLTQEDIDYINGVNDEDFTYTQSRFQQS